MSEADRAGQIRLSVDQEVFIDLISSGDVVEDANVATEVTSFERVGDAYVLEGAIVFAAYVSKDQAAQQGDADDAQRRHVHHRMPFMLRVPVAHQPRGVVNVASRISDWQLDVLGEGWLRVQAELFVNGLNGKHGFHFQCGAQEEGDVFFGKSPQSAQAVDTRGSNETEGDSELSDSYDTNEQDGAASAEEQFSLTRGSAESWRSFDSQDDDANDSVEQFSQARGGASRDEDEELPEPEASVIQEDTSDPVEAVRAERTAREELAEFDRFVPEGFSTDDASGGATYPTNVESIPASSDANRSDSGEVVSEFEFEHQVDVSKLQPMGHTSVAAHVNEARETTESFIPSRSFAEEGFHPTAGFVPEIKVYAQEPDGDDVQGQDERSLVDTSMWSFVDFNAPDNFVTLRYLVVMEEESISSLSERAGCSEAELVNANGLRGDGLVPGQILRVPLTAVSIR